MFGCYTKDNIERIWKGRGRELIEALRRYFPREMQEKQ
jgi:hypothetical protein